MQSFTSFTLVSGLIRSIYIIVLCLSCITCTPSNDKIKKLPTAIDSTALKSRQREEARIKLRNELDQQVLIDSLRLDKVLQDALRLATKNVEQKRFHYNYHVFPDSIPVSVSINLNNHFANDAFHLIIRREEPSTIFIDVYVKNNNQFEKVASHMEWELTHTSDTLQDINGDGMRDLVIHGYGISGCCLKAFSMVYLLKEDRKTFSDEFHFINPTFSPAEKTVRGICYGHPGETEMYKFRWNGIGLDTIEYVYFEKNDLGEKTGKIVVAMSPPYNDESKIKKRLNSVPRDYLKIEGYDWFTGNW